MPQKRLQMSGKSHTTSLTGMQEYMSLHPG